MRKYDTLDITNPELSLEWHPTNNQGLKPSDVTKGAHNKVWWLGKCGHEWQAAISSRARGVGCPYCRNYAVLAGYNDLATIKPQLAQEWNYDKNGELKPTEVTFGSHKKVWWKCSLGHEWEAIIYNRNKGIGCPYCNNYSVLVGFNDLATTNPMLAIEWNYEKNGDLGPTDVTSGSHRKVWWRCEKGHEWRIDIKSRSDGNNCPYCSNKAVLTGFNDLASTFPLIATEWSPKNEISPKTVIRGGDKKYYWICPFGHEDYLSSIDQRIRGQGCPKCAQQSQTSFPEQAIFYYIKQIFPDALNRYKIGRHEIDIYIPSKQLGIEYNGYFAHKEKSKKDKEKRAKLALLGIKLIVIKEYKKENECYGAEFYIHERTTYETLSNLILQILSYLNMNNTIAVDCLRDQTAINEQYIDSVKKNSITSAKPEIIKEWDYDKNGKIKPEYVSRNSIQKYFWICPKCGFSYLAAPTSRYRGAGCPACAGKVVQTGFNDLQTRHPEIAAEWDYEKNRAITPSTIFYRANQDVWWRCGNGHSWQKSVFSRTKNKSGCPYCTGRHVIPGFNDLQTKRPDLAEEWDYSLNEITPDQIHYNNQTIQAHWICKQCGFKWIHTVSNRDRCPECLKRKYQINVYDANELCFIGCFDNARQLCEQLGLNYEKSQRAISNCCRRVRKTFQKKYIMRYANDDEFATEQE